MQKIPYLSALKHEEVCARFLPGFYDDNGHHKELNCKLDEHKADIAADIGVHVQQLITLKQTHSNIVHLIDSHQDQLQLEGDALITGERDLYVAVKTADCCPILLHDMESKFVAAIHAGWRGALGGVIDNTISKMKDLGCDPQNIHAAIGPCIQMSSYEVGKDFHKDFLKESQEYEQFFHKLDGRLHFDLPGFVLYKLHSLGVKRIERHAVDTFSHKESYHSCRRATKAAARSGQPLKYGCQMSLIGMCLPI